MTSPPGMAVDLRSLCASLFIKFKIFVLLIAISGNRKAGPFNFKLLSPVGWLLSLKLTIVSRSLCKRTFLYRTSLCYFTYALSVVCVCHKTVPDLFLFMPPDRIIGGMLFLSCLFICLSVCLSIVSFNIRYDFWTVRGRDFIFGTNDALSNDTKVNDIVTLTLTIALKIAFLDFVAAGGIVSVSQAHLDFSYNYWNVCPFDCIMAVENGKVGSINEVNHQ